MRLCVILVLVLLALAMVTAASAAPQALGIGDGWHTFYWQDAPGWSDNPLGGFGIDNTETVTVKVTDLGYAGDAFEVWVDDVLALTTPKKMTGNTMAPSADAAYADSSFSSGSFDLAPGSHVLRLNIYQAADSYNYGAAAIRADVACAPVPEPSSLFALFSGLAGLGGIALRRRR